MHGSPAARSGYMPPGAGRIDRPRPALAIGAVRGLSPALAAQVEALFRRMDADGDGLITRAEARSFFKHFGRVSADAMFREVDEDCDDTVSLDEFLAFWAQVKGSGYSEESVEEELGELLEGNVWVDFLDGRGVGAG